MADVVIRPSLRFIKTGYVATVLFVAGAIWILSQYVSPEPRWLPAVAVFLLAWPIKRHLQRQAIKLTVEGEKLRFETGWFSKSTRIIQLPKVQDVRVNQSLIQRMLGVGDVSIETAGETSRLTVKNLDHPQVVANQIVDGFHTK